MSVRSRRNLWANWIVTTRWLTGWLVQDRQTDREMYDDDDERICAIATACPFRQHSTNPTEHPAAWRGISFGSSGLIRGSELKLLCTVYTLVTVVIKCRHTATYRRALLHPLRYWLTAAAAVGFLSRRGGGWMVVVVYRRTTMSLRCFFPIRSGDTSLWTYSLFVLIFALLERLELNVLITSKDKYWKEAPRTLRISTKTCLQHQDTLVINSILIAAVTQGYRGTTLTAMTVPRIPSHTPSSPIRRPQWRDEMICTVR